MHECTAVDRRHLCHHRSIRQIGFTFYHVALSISYSTYPIILPVPFASGLMNRCPLKGHSVLVYIRLCGKFHVGRSVLFPDVFADIRILAKTSATGEQRGNLSRHTFHQEANKNHRISSPVWLCTRYRVCGFIYTNPTSFSRALSPLESH